MDDSRATNLDAYSQGMDAETDSITQRSSFHGRLTQLHEHRSSGWVLSIHPLCHSICLDGHLLCSLEQPQLIPDESPAAVAGQHLRVTIDDRCSLICNVVDMACRLKMTSTGQHPPV